MHQHDFKLLSIFFPVDCCVERLANEKTIFYLFLLYEIVLQECLSFVLNIREYVFVKFLSFKSRKYSYTIVIGGLTNTCI